jgi:hypothetical protein
VPGNDLVEGIVFVSKDFLQDENLKSMIGQRQRLRTVFFLDALLLEKLNFGCYLGGVSTAAATRNGSLKQDFSFLQFFYFL